MCYIFLIFTGKSGWALFWKLAIEEVIKNCNLAISASLAALKRKLNSLQVIVNVLVTTVRHAGSRGRYQNHQIFGL